MAKLTVYFKDKVVHSGLFENRVVHIGRDETNDLIIDSLAVAPVNAVIIIRDDGSTIRQLTDDFPITINGEKIKECALKNNDTITIGKHDVIFKCMESIDQTHAFKNHPVEQADKDVISLNQEIRSTLHIPDASLQVIAGDNIGKLIPLKNSITRLGHRDSGMVVIEKREGNYLVSLLSNKGRILLNNRPLNSDTFKLNNQDILIIDNTSLQFFQG